MSTKNVTYKYSVDATGAVQTVGDMRKEYNSLNKALNETVQHSEDYFAILNRMADLKSGLVDVKQEIAALDPGSRLKALGTVATSAIGAFTGLTGAMQLFTGSSDELQETLVKLNAGMALLQGSQAALDAFDDGVRIFKGLGQAIANSSAVTKLMGVANTVTAATFKTMGIAVDTASTSFKALRGAIIATGIGALIVGIGLLIEKLSTLKSSAEEAEEQLKSMNEAAIRLADAGLKGEQDFVSRYEQLATAQAKVRGAKEEEITAIQINAQEQRIRSLQRYHAELNQNEVLNGEKLIEITNQIKNEQTKLEVIRLNAEAKLNEEAKKKREKFLEEEKKAFEAFRNYLKEGTLGRLSSKDKEIQLEREKYTSLLALARKYHFDVEALRSEHLRRIVDLENSGQVDNSERKKQNYSDDLSALSQYAGQVAAIYQTVTVSKAEQDAAQKQLDDEKRIAFANNAVAVGDALGALSQLAGEHTVAGKALAVSQAVINTYAGATNALAMSGPPWVGIAMAIAVIANGLASVKKIMDVKVPGKGSGNASTSFSPPSYSAPSVPTRAVMTNLSPESVSDVATATAQTTLNVNVGVSEITNTQQRVNNYESAASIG